MTLPNSDQKVPTVVRPSTSTTSNSHRPFIIRENSLRLDQSIKSQPDSNNTTDKLDKTDKSEKKELPAVKSPTGSQSNIIHITVNNYITNNNINQIEGTKIQVGPKTAPTEEPKGNF